MIIRIRLKAYPEKYIGRDSVTNAFACDETRKGGTHPAPPHSRTGEDRFLARGGIYDWRT